MHHFRRDSIAGPLVQVLESLLSKIIGIGRQKSEPFGLIELLTFVKGIESGMSLAMLDQGLSFRDLES